MSKLQAVAFCCEMRLSVAKKQVRHQPMRANTALRDQLRCHTVPAARRSVNYALLGPTALLLVMAGVVR